MSGEALHKEGVESEATAQPSAPSGRHVSVEQRRRLVAESLRVGNPGNNSRELPTQADPRHDCQIELSVDDIRPYENNPRRAGNARFAEIKESIRASGIRNPLSVTRRPGDKHFIVEAGGNTRLLAVQQLWAETRDARFQKLVVLFRPWRSESHVLTAHLIENELRGEMTFWDKATGVASLKARLETEKGHPLSLRQLEDAMKGFGLSVNTSTLAHSLFATERLRTLGEAVAALSGLDVKTMQPQLNLLKRYAQAQAVIAEADLYATVFEPVFQDAADQYRRSRAFSAAEVCRACEDALARRLGESVEQLRAALHSRERTPQTSSETPPERGDAHRSPQAAPIPPTTVTDPPRAEPRVSTANTCASVPARRLATERFNPKDEDSLALSQVTEQVRTFADLAGIGESLRLDADAPLGYRLEALPEQLRADRAPAIARRAWWLLRLLSGQFDNEAHGASTSSPKPLSFDAAFFAWLVDLDDDAATAFWNLLAHLRESRVSSSILRAMDCAMPQAGAG